MTVCVRVQEHMHLYVLAKGSDAVWQKTQTEISQVTSEVLQLEPC